MSEDSAAREASSVNVEFTVRKQPLDPRAELEREVLGILRSIALESQSRGIVTASVLIRAAFDVYADRVQWRVIAENTYRTTYKDVEVTLSRTQAQWQTECRKGHSYKRYAQPSGCSDDHLTSRQILALADGVFFSAELSTAR